MAHFQFYVRFSNPVRIAALRKVDPKGHYENIKKDNGVADYCMKEETRLDGPFEFGIKPRDPASKTDWAEVKALAIAGKLDNIPDGIFVRYYNSLLKIKKDHMIFAQADHLRGIWIVGPPGVGKSRKAREDYPNVYPKMCNKWWDGYQGEKNVIVEDLDIDHAKLGHHLKIWSDRYGFIMETKGGAVTGNYDWIIVTSQFTIEQIWPERPDIITALIRRFRVIKMPAFFGQFI